MTFSSILRVSKTTVLGSNREASVRLAFVGDIMLARGIGQRLTKGASLLATEVVELLEQADFRCGNLECPIAKFAEKKRPNGFRAAFESADLLRHFDLVNLANNHIFDCGDDGIRETLSALQNLGVGHVGVGANGNSAYAPLVLKRGTTSFAFFGCTSKEIMNRVCDSKHEVALADDMRMARAVEFASREADVTVVLFHGGNEYIPYPPPTQRHRLRRLCQSGANVIVTQHPHVLGGYEQLDRSHFIWHSLGDFVFDSDLPARRKSGILLMQIDAFGIHSFRLAPTYAADDYTVRLAKGLLEREIRTSVAKASRAIQSDDYDAKYSRRYLAAMFMFQARRLVHKFRKVGPFAAVKFCFDRSLLLGHYFRKFLKGEHS